MTILDPISGCQVMFDPSGKPYRPNAGPSSVADGMQQVSADQTADAKHASQSPRLPTRRPPPVIR